MNIPTKLPRLLTQCIFVFFALCILPAATAQQEWLDHVSIENTTHFSNPESLDDSYNRSVKWIKFTLVFDTNGDRIYFQNSHEFLFHHPFAAAHIPEFDGISANDFDQQTLYNDGRTAVVGAVLVIQEANDYLAYAIQIAALDPMPKELVAQTYHQINAAITAPSGTPGYYFPSYEQAATAEAEQAWFAQNDIQVSSIDNWQTYSSIYASGWAVGRLVRVPGNQIAAAYTSGELTPDDILLTDNLPAEIPFVAGIITEKPTTPNSHVAILAQSWQIPFVHFIAAEREDLNDWIGHKIVLRALFQGYPYADYFPLDPDIPTELLAEILSLKTPPDLNILPMSEAGTLWIPADDLHPDDIDLVGGKAAHYGLLRGAIPDNSPTAIALTFDLWNEFLNQELPGRGKTLRAEIAAHLEPFQSWPTDAGALQAALLNIRDIIEDETSFTQDQRSIIIDALSIFDPEHKIRFRSSSNVEDSDYFTGAGLYSSYSGCLPDDLDSDNDGPSLCDPGEKNERGVFRAIRKVFASFYNDNAFAERLRHGVNESDVGMAVLVHHSFPDEIELANGVAVLTPSQGSTNQVNITLVTQKGAVSVTNPDGSATPERVEGSSWNGAAFNFYIREHSSLLRLGETSVLRFPDEYNTLTEMMLDVREAWITARPSRDQVSLEFEYKKTAPEDQLIIKQVRPLPVHETSGDASYLLGESIDLEVFQGEQADVFALHRAKSKWQLTSDSRKLFKTTSESSSFLKEAKYQRASDGELLLEQSPPSTWPSAQHSVEYDDYLQSYTYIDEWQETINGISVKRSLRMSAPKLPHPLLRLSDMSILLQTDFPTRPVPWDTFPIGYEPDPNDPISEYIRLAVQNTGYPDASDLHQHRIVSSKEVTADINFYWAPKPRDIVPGYTAPLSAWNRTKITGLTRNPFSLRQHFSQTYRPDHHNIGERFLFEPQLEPSLSASVKAELTARNIRLIFVRHDSAGNGISYIDYAGAQHDTPPQDPLTSWFGDFQYFANGFRQSEWFGLFHITLFPFIYHADLGWIYTDQTATEGMWIFDLKGTHGWLWTHAYIYPYCFHMPDGDWVYIDQTEDGQSWLYHYNQSQWSVW